MAARTPSASTRGFGSGLNSKASSRPTTSSRPNSNKNKITINVKDKNANNNNNHSNNNNTGTHPSTQQHSPHHVDRPLEVVIGLPVGVRSIQYLPPKPASLVEEEKKNLEEEK